MKILLTNDDGYLSEGINNLYDILSVKHDIYLIAPDREMSACSNAFSTSREMVIKQIDERKFAIHGFPADCVGVGLHSGIIPEVDIVISGINHGPNLGDDTFFSGTVGGARTAYIFGKTGIAISMDSYHKPSLYFSEAASFLHLFLQDYLSLLQGTPLFLNINYPDLPRERIRSIKYTFLGRRNYKDTYSRKNISQDEFTLTLKGEIFSEGGSGSDVYELSRGNISITPLTINNTDFMTLERIKEFPSNLTFERYHI